MMKSYLISLTLSIEARSKEEAKKRFIAMVKDGQYDKYNIADETEDEE